MAARKYNKKIEVYETTNTAADFGGGSISETVLLAKIWCQISTFTVGKNYNSTDYGLIDVNDTLIIKTRKRDDITYNSINQYIKYRGEKYIITTDPINVNFEDREIQFLVKKASNTVING